MGRRSFKGSLIKWTILGALLVAVLSHFDVISLNDYRIRNAWYEVQAFFSRALGYAGDTIEDTVNGAVSDVKRQAEDVVEDAKRQVGGAVEGAARQAEGTLNQATQGVKDTVDEAADQVKTQADEIKRDAQQQVNEVKQELQ